MNYLVKYALFLSCQPTGQFTSNPTPTLTIADYISDGPKLDLSNILLVVHHY